MTQRFNLENSLKDFAYRQEEIKTQNLIELLDKHIQELEGGIKKVENPHLLLQVLKDIKEQYTWGSSKDPKEVEKYNQDILDNLEKNLSEKFPEESAWLSIFLQ